MQPLVGFRCEDGAGVFVCWRALLAVAAIPLLCTPFGCRSAPHRAPLKGADVVLVVIDTLRSDHLGLHGYALPTSPFLDRLASESAVFTDVVAPSSYTRESIAGLFSGQWPSCVGAVGWDASPRKASVTLAERLRASGYATTMLTLTTMLSDGGFARGFDRVEHLTSEWGVSRAGAALTRRALEVWNEPRGKPLFLYVHYLDPHGPYDPPPEKLARFAPASSVVLDLYRDIRPRLPELVAEGFGPEDPRFRELVRRYDAEIADTDAAVQQLTAGLRARPSQRPLLVVITADHGEEFLDHGFVEHAWTLYEESVRIPLLWWSPGYIPATRSSQPASLVDVAPTLLALLGLDSPRVLSEATGQALFQASNAGVTIANLGSRVRFAELAIAERNVARAVWFDGWKYVVARRWLDVDERARSSRIEEQLRQQGRVAPPPPAVVVREELFHLPSDPEEQRSLFASAPEVLPRLRAFLAEHERRCPLVQPLSERPVTLAPHESEALRQLGY